MEPREVFACELAKVARDWRTRFDLELKPLELTCARALALRALLQADRPLAQSQLAIELGIEHPTCVRLVDGLEGQGLVARRTLDEDRRVKHLLLTRSGRRLAGRTESLMTKLWQRYLQGIDAGDLRAATHVLSVIAGNLDRCAAGRFSPADRQHRRDTAGPPPRRR